MGLSYPLKRQEQGQVVVKLIGFRADVKRVPATLVGGVRSATSSRFKLPLFLSRVQAGFPTSVEECLSEKIDLNERLVRQSSATFLVRATGDAMKEAGIHDGDLLVVDRSLKPSQGRIVVASVDGHLAVRYYRVRRGQAYLASADEVLPPIPVEPKRGIEIWGVVTSSIHSH